MSGVAIATIAVAGADHRDRGACDTDCLAFGGYLMIFAVVLIVGMGLYLWLECRRK